MNKSNIHILGRISTALFLTFALAVLTACGANTGNSAPASPAAPADKETSAAAETGTAAESDETASESSDTIVLPEGFEDGLVYQKNDVTIQITDYHQSDSLHALSCDFTNGGSKPLELRMIPLLINGEAVTDGYYIKITPEEAEQVDFYIEADMLAFAGMEEIRTIDAFLQIEDEEGKPVSDPEIIRLIQNDASPSAHSLQHSADVLYDEAGIKMSYLGAFINTYGESKAVYLVSNDSEETIEVDSDYDFSMVDGVPGGEKDVSSFSVNIPSGTKGLYTLGVHDSKNYNETSFETIDTRILIKDSEKYKEIASIPVHLTEEGDSILSSVDDSYYKDYFSTACDAYEVPSESEARGYEIYYYEKGTRTFQGLINEVVFPKSTGVSRENFANLNLEESFPGIYSLDFAEFVLDEDEDNFYYIMIFRDLDDPGNLRLLNDTGYISLADPDSYSTVNVDESFRMLESKGYTKISPDDYEAYGIRADLYQDD